MIRRNLLKELHAWKESTSRKPLVIRGARQVGKTTLITEFSKEYDVFLSLNLEKDKDKKLFEQHNEVELLLQAIYFQNKQIIKDRPTLLFIDEIQYSSKAISMLRYFYEETPHIHVIAAGSLLEALLNEGNISFPVGRVSYLPVRPCNFIEFLDGIEETFDKELLKNINADPVHDRMINNFRQFTLIGGMPEIINEYSKNKDILALQNIYTSLLASYIDDAEKYATNDSQIQIIRHILKVGWKMAGDSIVFEKFGGSNFRSREVGNAFRTLQKAFLLELSYPISQTKLPIQQNLRKKPRLFMIDTGLVNFYSQIQTDVFSTKNIQDIWRGRIAEHVVGQELLSLDNSILSERNFWRKDKLGSDAEIDFVFPFNGNVIPIEVKSGHNSKLKSLHIFMNDAPHDIAIRVWNKKFSIDIVKTPQGKSFRLLNIPFYYVCIIDEILMKI
jgi:predicted AAA+ superfamily ATPase